MTKIITIIGEICSGKSSLAGTISTTHKIPIASFSSYLKHYCVENSLPQERKDLQNLGEEFIRNSPAEFLQNVIKFSSTTSPLIIVEGVRHKVILANIQQLFKNRFAVYVDAPYELRLQRYLSRNRDSDVTKSEIEFELISKHPVEVEIVGLKNNCDIVFNSGKDDPSIVMRSIGTFIIA